jgi:hypothetical protein
MEALRRRNLGTMRSVFGVGCFGVALAVPLLLSLPAQAQVACGTTTCPQGFVCQTIPGACPAILCEGPDCKPCTPTDSYVCVAAPCAADTDCGPNMVCNARDQLSCSGAGVAPACPRGETCDAAAVPVEPPTCTTTTVSECTYRWQLPCQADSDCGSGFTCKERQVCTCSGSSAAVGRAGSVAVPPADVVGTGGAPSTTEQCSCQPSGSKGCDLVQVACTLDADCATGWTCQENLNGVCSTDSTGGTLCTPADPPQYCVPAGWSATRASVALDGSATNGTATGSTTGATPDAGSSTPTVNTSPNASPAAPAAANPAEPATEAGGGCSTAPTHDSPWSSLALGLGALWVFGRRRR